MKTEIMIFKIAWRNVWRNKVRSLVVIGAMTIGVWALIFMISFYLGLMNSMVEGTIQKQTSHIQIHHPEYLKEFQAKYTIDNAPEILKSLNGNSAVKSTTARTITNGMVITTRNTRGVIIRGINPETERLTTKLDEQLVAGEYFTKTKNPILISTTLAKKLKIDIHAERPTRLVLQFQNLEGIIIPGRFRINGFYESGNSKLDELNVYVRDSDLQRLLGTTEHQTHEIAVLLNELELTDTMKNKLTGSFMQVDTLKTAIIDTLSPAAYQTQKTALAVESYKDINKTVKLSQEQMGVMSSVLTFIFMFALVFGIINTMLMAILERIRELGMLMAIGMNKFKVFSMIVFETIFLCVIGAPIGVLAGHLTVLATGSAGINLSAFAEGMKQFGIETIVYPILDPSIYLSISSAVVITALIGSFYPALKAIRFKPVEALRKI